MFPGDQCFLMCSARASRRLEGQALRVIGADLDRLRRAGEVIVECTFDALAGSDVSLAIVGRTGADLDEGDAALLAHGHRRGVAAVVVEAAAEGSALGNIWHRVHGDLLRL